MRRAEEVIDAWFGTTGGSIKKAMTRIRRAGKWRPVGVAWEGDEASRLSSVRS